MSDGAGGWGGATWHASDAPHVGVAGVEAVEHVGGLSGVQNHHLGGGAGADAHPHPAGRVVLQHQLLVLLPSLLNAQIHTSALTPAPTHRWPRRLPAHLVVLLQLVQAALRSPGLLGEL